MGERMLTSNFFRTKGNSDAWAISRGLPRFYDGKVYEPLRPTRQMLRAGDEGFDRMYSELLSKLDPRKVLEDLGTEAILLCWENPAPHWHKCHRRLVAEWLEAALGIEITEMGFLRREVPAYGAMPLSPSWAAKQAKRSPQLGLF